MRPGGAFLFSEARDALHPGGTTNQNLPETQNTSLQFTAGTPPRPRLTAAAELQWSNYAHE